MPLSVSVSELTEYLRQVLDLDDQLRDLWVEGEVSNMSQASSGHWYFTIKDDKAQIKCAMWRSQAQRQTFVPQNGDSVLVHGYVSVYPAQGIYQLYADRVRALGTGDLFAQFEQLKQKLEAEGLFGSERKQGLPRFPRQIGVVTSEGAAAFQDVQNVLKRRYPLAEIILSPCLVQGAEAPAQIVRAIEKLNRYTQVDVILVCRGGGSMEDLWAFNDEGVARAIAASAIPVISGVGHETDFTIADFVADVRAPTPSAAAELLTPDIADLGATVLWQAGRLAESFRRQIKLRRESLVQKQWSLRQVSPLVRLRTLRQRIDDLNLRMSAAQRGRLTLLRERLSARERALIAASPEAILARGYAIVTSVATGERITSVDNDQAVIGGTIHVRLHDGALIAEITNRKEHDENAG
jgi:exodeoxyribonuclease VII large subunit